MKLTARRDYVSSPCGVYIRMREVQPADAYLSPIVIDARDFSRYNWFQMNLQENATGQSLFLSNELYELLNMLQKIHVL